MRILGRIVFVGLMLAALVSPLAAQSNRSIYLFVVSHGNGSPGNVAVFKVDSTTGGLSPVPGSPFQAGSSPGAIAVDPTGRFVYVTDGTNVGGYSVNPTTEALTPLPGSPYPSGGNPGPMTVDPTGRFLYIADADPYNNPYSQLMAFSIDGSTGVLTPLPGSPYPVSAIPSTIVVDPYGTFAYIGAKLLTSLQLASINFQTGVPSIVTAGGRNMSSIALTPNDQFAFVPNSYVYGAGGFAIDPITGYLKPLQSLTSAISSAGVAAAIDPFGKFLYIETLSNGNSSSKIAGYQIDYQNQTLIPVSGSPFSAGYDLSSIVWDPTGHFAYAGYGALYGLAINSSSGALTPLAGSPWLAPAGISYGALAISFGPTGTSNLAPSISSLFPFSGTTGGAGFGLTVNGANFVPGSTVYFGERGRATTYVNSTQLIANILPADIAKDGTGVVFVFNPPPGGGASTSFGFPVYNPAPIVAAINPPTVTAGGLDFTLEVDGSNFISDSVVNFNGSPRATNYVSSGKLQTTITTADIVHPGTANLTVTNPATAGLGGGTSGAATLNIVQTTVQPVIGQLTPGSATAGGPAFPLDITGNGFTSTSTVNFGTLNVPVTSFSPTLLSANIPASAIAAVGTVLVSVSVPGVGVSAGATFYVNGPAPVIGAVSPPSVPAGSAALTLTLTGTNFTPASTVLVNGSARQTTYVKSTTLQAQLLSGDFAAGGTLNITVSNQATGGGSSAAMTLTVADYSVTPTFTSASVAAGQAASFSFTVAPSSGGFTNPVTFTASNLPPMASASFTPSAPVTPGSSSVPVTLSISTTAHSSSSIPASPERRLPRLPFSAAWLGVLAMLGWMWVASFERKRRLAPQFALACVLLIAAGLSACGGGAMNGGTTSGPQLNPNTGTPAGSYTIPVTATSGGVSHVTNVTLTVM